MYIIREIEKEVLSLINQYPILTLTGPRQSGKTTLVRKLFPHLPYFSMESPDIRMAMLEDPRSFLSQNPNGAILDEVQNTPEILSYLQEFIDLSEIKPSFILTGSNHLLLIDKVTQSLAGRTALLNLLPFTINELRNKQVVKDSDQLMTTGFYPGLHTRSIQPYKAYRMYFETYLEKDVRNISNLKNLTLFEKMIRLCAGRIGNILNLSNLANETGLSVTTINTWIALLEASFIVFKLPPYHYNINKRLIKSPKLYFYDTGLACFLLGIEKPEQLMRDPLRGAIFENMVVVEFLKKRLNLGLDSNLYFFRDSHQNEVDLIIRQGTRLVPIEIKSSQTYNPDFLKGIRYLRNLLPDLVDKPELIYDGNYEGEIDGIRISNFRSI